MRVQQQKTIILDEFNEIELYFKGNVRIKQGGKYTITFIEYSLLLDNIKKPVINNKLIINLNNPFCKPSIAQEIIITTPNLQKLILREKSQTVISDFENQKNLNLQILSNSSVELNDFIGLEYLEIELKEGSSFTSKKQIKSVSLMKIHILGNGHVNSYSIRAQKVEVEIHGKGYCEVTALKRLDVNVVGNGNVYYMGMPKIHKRINGKGDVYCSN